MSVVNDAGLSVSVQPDDRLVDDSADLIWRIKTTAGSRFNAAERLKRKEQRVNVLSAVASAAVIFLSVVSATVQPTGLGGISLTLVTIFASIMILVTALIQYASNDGANAERMHACALLLGALRRRLMYAEIKSRAELGVLSAEYDDILSRYANHAPADYQKYRDEHPDEFKDARRGLGPGGATPERARVFLSALAPVVVGLLALLASLVSVFPGLLSWLERK